MLKIKRTYKYAAHDTCIVNTREGTTLTSIKVYAYISHPHIKGYRLCTIYTHVYIKVIATSIIVVSILLYIITHTYTLYIYTFTPPPIHHFKLPTLMWPLH